MPATCATGGAVHKPRIVLRQVHTPAADDTLSFSGEIVLPEPFTPPVEADAPGVGIVVADADGTRVLDVTIPGGAFDPASRRGWRTTANGTTWTWIDRGASPLGGIATVSLKHLSSQQPGLVRFKVVGRRGDYAVDPAKLPLTGLLVLDPPTAETGQCGATSFAGAAQQCATNGKSVRCYQRR